MYFSYYKDAAGFWRWRLVGANHEIVAWGEGYSNESSCLHAIELVKRSWQAPTHKHQ